MPLDVWVEMEAQWLIRIHQTQADRLEGTIRQAVEAGDEKTEPNPWLRRVGWAEHL
jgi:hypothetical protein